MKRNQRSGVSIGMSPAKHGIACPHDGGTEIPGFDGRIFRVEPNIGRRSDVGTPHVSCSRQVRCALTAFRYGCENLRK